MNRILTGVDFSDGSANTARWACRFLAPGGQATLCHVVPSGLPDFLESMADLLTAREGTAEDEARERLEDLAHALSCDVSTQVLRGRPADRLARLAADVDADLLAIGPRGARASRLGTTAEQLVRQADRPVLVVHEPNDADPERLLLAVDASALAPQVLRWGQRLMARFEATATVLHVLDEDILVGLRMAPPGSPERERSESALAATDAWLTELTREAGLDERRTTTQAVFGSPVHEIATRTENHEHDLVVMGSRGLGGVRREVVGSVASSVLRAAWGPVMVV